MSGQRTVNEARRTMVSIIIVNWNGAHLLRQCLDSVCRQNFADYEIILVDNGSSDNSVELVERDYPAVQIVRLGSNRGFAGGNNEGLLHARGDFVVLLNTDAMLAENWLDAAVAAMKANASIGTCFAKIVIGGTDLIDSAGDQFSSAFHAIKIGEFEREDRHHERRFVTGACAAAVMYRRSMIDQIGFFDQDFFLNAEDTDLNMRAWLAGWKCLFLPESAAYHKVSATLGKMSDVAVYHYSRNIEWVWLKNVPFHVMIKYLPQRLLYECIAFFYYCIVSGKWRPYLKGKADAYLNLSTILRKRKQVQTLVKLNSRQISAELLSFREYVSHSIAGLRHTSSTDSRPAS
jgi:GT2 family glycosyltransferase